MAMVKKSITVTDQQEQWMQAQLASGNYASDSELLRDLIRKEQQRNAEVEAIRLKLIEAEQSGFSSRTPAEIISDVIKRKQSNGEI
ncbi:type II toxin-antitoxin system ParD family antitoxin [Saccharobesus litoralis]|uniref:Antitoxin ParD n=1 Tax=Saccharobesus litoralis TaxID=2172099 RepID=A0A2S0VUK5_9ALTE|nr:type II toxin-antitoxin system ParD family antitoxin [Saccharobesus litoralis]AWB67904.1 type II toxin-antitoxin system ParD family antitoxin [Saccharobesus litoralis]